MKANISALMDGELDAGELGTPLRALQEDADAREAWRLYHMISDALHGGSLLSSECAQRVSERLAQEPALIGPLPAPVAPLQRPRWFVPSALAASLAAVVLVGWMAFAPQQNRTPEAQPLAASVAQPAPPAQPVARVSAPTRQPLTAATRDYVTAHQAFSFRPSLQGMAPSVRAVSTEPSPGRKP